MKTRMGDFDKFFLGPFYGAYLSKFLVAEKVENLKAALVETEAKFVKEIGEGKWLSGRDEPMMIDIYAYTLVEKTQILAETDFDFAAENTPYLAAFVARFREHKNFKDHVMKYSYLQKHAKGTLSGEIKNNTLGHKVLEE